MDRLEKHYTEKYENAIEPKLIEIKDIPTNRLEAAIKFITEYFQKGSILEIGAGNGDIAYSLQHHDLKFDKYYLNEISESRKKLLQKYFNNDKFEIVDFNIENGNNFNNKVDAIIMIALIEHLIDPITALENCYNLLNDGGFIYIDTPNIATYYRRKQLLFGKFPSTASLQEGTITFEGKPVDLFDEGHLHYFTYRSLTTILKRVGFKEIIWLGYCNSKQILGKKIMFRLAKKFPTMFSDVVIIAKK